MRYVEVLLVAMALLAGCARPHIPLICRAATVFLMDGREEPVIICVPYLKEIPSE